VTTSPSLALVADDLTGACDAGVPFLRLGWSVEVSLKPDLPIPSADLAVIATNTRAETAARARDVIRALALRLREAGRTVLYKKMDSTLHGNFGAELDALLECGLAQFALVCPAFPEMGRRFAEGELLLGDERRATGRNVRVKLGEQCARQIVCLDVNSVRLDSAELSACIRKKAEGGVTLFTFDAETESDVARVAELSRHLQPDAMPCGSTGLARQLAAALERGFPDPQRPRCFERAVALESRVPVRGEPGEEALREPVPPATVSEARPLVCLIGSTSPITRQQVEALVAERGARVLPLREVTVALLRTTRASPIVLTIQLGSPDEWLLPVQLQLLRPLRGAALMLSGGDTAQLVCATSGATGVRLAGEIVTGFPYGALLGGWFDGWPVATKAGGFGDSHALVRCSDFFNRTRPAPA
jgi:uncharacterized protein YgbK (DUF1537 family)